MKNIAVVGAGFLGRLAAWRLAREGHQVCLLDRFGLEHINASLAAGGMLAPFRELDIGEIEVCQAGLFSLEHWPMILKQLHKPVFYAPVGSVVVAAPGEENELTRFKDRVELKVGRDKSLPQNPVHLISNNELTELEPALGDRFEKALFFPSEAHLHTQQLMDALAESFLAENGRFIMTSDIDQLNSNTLKVAGKSVTYDYVIDTRGYGAKSDIPELRSIRGEAFIVRAPEVTFHRSIRMMHPRHPIYVVPRPDQTFFVGATAIETDRDDGPSVRSVLNILSSLYYLNPAFGEAEVIEWRVGLRPAFPDNLPRVSVLDNGLIRLNGMFRHGLLLSPYLVEQVVEKISQGKS